MSYIPKYIIKRMFPKKKCAKVVNKGGKKWIWIQMTNVISPISIPDGPIDLGGFNPENIGDYLTIKINGKDVKPKFDAIKNHVELWHAGEGYSYEDILVNNKASGVTIPVGGKITLLISEDYGPEVNELVPGPGEYEVSVDLALDNPINLSVKAEISEFGTDFDPSDT